MLCPTLIGWKYYNGFNGIIKFLSWVFGIGVDLSKNRVELDLDNLWDFKIEIDSRILTIF
jgi:hypothetical protein